MKAKVHRADLKKAAFLLSLSGRKSDLGNAAFQQGPLQPLAQASQPFGLQKDSCISSALLEEKGEVGHQNYRC